MWKVSNAAVIAFLAVATVLMIALVTAQDADDGYTYGDNYEGEEGWQQS